MTLYKGNWIKKASPLNQAELAKITIAINADIPANNFAGQVPLPTVGNNK